MSQKQQILKLLAQSDDPLTTNTVAEEFGVHWKTVDDELHEK
jgi:Mn-dependent DtxR family transcriptional regulator